MADTQFEKAKKLFTELKKSFLELSTPASDGEKIDTAIRSAPKNSAAHDNRNPSIKIKVVGPITTYWQVYPQDGEKLDTDAIIEAFGNVQKAQTSGNEPSEGKAAAVFACACILAASAFAAIAYDHSDNGLAKTLGKELKVIPENAAKYLKLPTASVEDAKVALKNFDFCPVASASSLGPDYNFFFEYDHEDYKWDGEDQKFYKLDTNTGSWEKIDEDDKEAFHWDGDSLRNLEKLNFNESRLYEYTSNGSWKLIDEDVDDEDKEDFKKSVTHSNQNDALTELNVELSDQTKKSGNIEWFKDVTTKGKVTIVGGEKTTLGPQVDIGPNTRLEGSKSGTSSISYSTVTGDEGSSYEVKGNKRSMNVRETKIYGPYEITSSMIKAGVTIGEKNGEKVTIDQCEYIDEETVIGSNTTVYKSLVGKKVTISPDCQILNSFVPDDSTVGEGSIIRNRSVFGKSADIGQNVVADNVTAGQDFKVGDGATLINGTATDFVTVGKNANISDFHLGTNSTVEADVTASNFILHDGETLKKSNVDEIITRSQEEIAEQNKKSAPVRLINWGLRNLQKLVT